MDEPGRAAGGTTAATRVADLLLLFADGPGPLGVSEISRRLRLSKAVVHRILQSLAARALLTPSDGGYRLGPALVALGARAVASNDLRRVALPVLRRLQSATGETATVSALIGLRRVYLDQVVSHSEIKMTVEVGRPFPLHAGASGRVILAFGNAELRHGVLDEALEPLTARTITDRSELEESLATTVADGYATSLGERQHGAGSVAAAVFGVDGAVTGSISACGPVDRFHTETVTRLAPQVTAAAAQVSTLLGAPQLAEAVSALPHAAGASRNRGARTGMQSSAR